jgi:hypothetical protein
MTQYYETRAQILESEGRWGAAAEAGTRVEICDICADDLPYQQYGTCQDCIDD